MRRQAQPKTFGAGYCIVRYRAVWCVSIWIYNGVDLMISLELEQSSISQGVSGWLFYEKGPRGGG